MTRHDKLIFVALTWATVYPGVLLFGYLISWLFPEMPTWARIMLSTLMTVPLISMFVIPRIEALIARLHDESLADLRREQADALEDD